MPSMGIGLYKMKGQEVVQSSVATALAARVTLFDTAFVYGNEESLGKALAEEGGGGSQQLTVVTKLWRSHYSFSREEIVRRFETHLANLGRPMIDLWLIHWPGPGRHPKLGTPKPIDWSPEMRVATWKHMCSLLGPSLKSVGVSNFSAKQILQLERETGMLPAVNQFEMHPLCPRTDLVEFCHQKQIVVMAYGVLGSRRDDLLGNPTIVDIAQRHGVTSARVLIAWARAKRVCVLFGSKNPEHIRANAMPDDWILPAESEKEIDGMEAKYGRRVMGWQKNEYDLDAVDIPHPEFGDTWK